MTFTPEDVLFTRTGNHQLLFLQEQPEEDGYSCPLQRRRCDSVGQDQLGQGVREARTHACPSPLY
jgi:hypothetical protein